MTILFGPNEGLDTTTQPAPTPVTLLSSVQSKAFRAWQSRFVDTSALGALTDWQTSTAPDGRPLHTARIDCPRSVDRIQEIGRASCRERV